MTHRCSNTESRVTPPTLNSPNLSEDQLSELQLNILQFCLYSLHLLSAFALWKTCFISSLLIVLRLPLTPGSCWFPWWPWPTGWGRTQSEYPCGIFSLSGLGSIFSIITQSDSSSRILKVILNYLCWETWWQKAEVWLIHLLTFFKSLQAN